MSIFTHDDHTLGCGGGEPIDECLPECIPDGVNPPVGITEWSEAKEGLYGDMSTIFPDSFPGSVPTLS